MFLYIIKATALHFVAIMLLEFDYLNVSHIALVGFYKEKVNVHVHVLYTAASDASNKRSKLIPFSPEQKKKNTF